MFHLGVDVLGVEPAHDHLQARDEEDQGVGHVAGFVFGGVWFGCSVGW